MRVPAPGAEIFLFDDIATFTIANLEFHLSKVTVLLAIVVVAILAFFIYAGAKALLVSHWPVASEAAQLNEAFNHWIVQRTPFVTVKAAMTLDGKIATASGEAKWITGEKARAFGMKLRQGNDAILVGVNTVLADDPSLTFRRQKAKGKRQKEKGNPSKCNGLLRSKVTPIRLVRLWPPCFLFLTTRAGWSLRRWARNPPPS